MKQSLTAILICGWILSCNVGNQDNRSKKDTLNKIQGFIDTNAMRLGSLPPHDSTIHYDSGYVPNIGSLTVEPIWWRNERGKLMRDTLIYDERPDGTKYYYYVDSLAGDARYSGFSTGPISDSSLPTTLREAMKHWEDSILSLPK